MQLPIILLLLGSTGFSTAFGIYGKDDAALQSSFRNGDEFLNRVGDWFRHLKDRVYDKLFGRPTVSPPPLTMDISDADGFQLENRSKNDDRSPLDLSALDIDPDADWGFRIGNWYFIRKGNRNSMDANNRGSGEWDVRLRTSDQPPDEYTVTTIAFTSDVMEDRANTKPSSNMSGTTEPAHASTVAQSIRQVKTQSTTQATTQLFTEIDLKDAPTTDKKELSEDKETDNELVHKGSVEVLMK